MIITVTHFHREKEIFDMVNNLIFLSGFQCGLHVLSARSLKHQISTMNPCAKSEARACLFFIARLPKR